MSKPFSEGRQVWADEARDWSRLVDALEAKTQSLRRSSWCIGDADQPVSRELKQSEIADWEHWLQTGMTDVPSKDTINQPPFPQVKAVVATAQERLAERPRRLVKQPPEPRILRRLNQGKMEPDQRVDLHGLTIREARVELRRFFTIAIRDESKLLLVITGKGTRRFDKAADFGVLRKMFPQWLTAGPYARRVWHYCHAHPRHGGNGAYYVFLRKPKVRSQLECKASEHAQ